MKWFALALLFLNLVVWQIETLYRPALKPVTSASGSLPRVASLKVEDEPFVPVGLEGDERLCVRLGWLKSLDIAREIKAHSAFDSTARVAIAEVDRPLPSLHWVIIPPQPPAVALEQFRNMQRRGVDSYLVMEGEYRNAISLGLFESREAAISVLEEKKRMNFNAVLANFDRNQLSYALSFEVEPDLVKEMVQAVEMEFGVKFDLVEVNRCEGVATPVKSP